MAATSRAQAPQDLGHWLNRQQAALLMDVAYTTLLALEKKGLLHPQQVRGPSGRMIYVYDPDELIARVPRRKIVANNQPGEKVARAYELFELGKSINDIVVEMRETAAQVREWREEWLDGGGADYVLNRQARAELAAVVGAFATVPELIERVRERAGKAATPP
jgi:DNA-binding transcriptional MerR regulator